MDDSQSPATSPRAGRRRDCDGQTADPTGWRVASDCANADAWQLRAVIECAGTCITFETFVCSLEALLDQGPGARGGDGQ
jgi:hypothetical protein